MNRVRRKVEKQQEDDSWIDKQSRLGLSIQTPTKTPVVTLLADDVLPIKRPKRDIAEESEEFLKSPLPFCALDTPPTSTSSLQPLQYQNTKKSANPKDDLLKNKMAGSGGIQGMLASSHASKELLEESCRVPRPISRNAEMEAIVTTRDRLPKKKPSIAVPSSWHTQNLPVFATGLETPKKSQRGRKAIAGWQNSNPSFVPREQFSRKAKTKVKVGIYAQNDAWNDNDGLFVDEKDDEPEEKKVKKADEPDMDRQRQRRRKTGEELDKMIGETHRTTEELLITSTATTDSRPVPRRSLRNPGDNRCFLNSSLQALSALDDFSRRLSDTVTHYSAHLLDSTSPTPRSSHVAFRSLHLLMCILRGVDPYPPTHQIANYAIEKSYKEYVLTEFRTEFAKSCGNQDFDKRKQMDVEEFLLCMINWCDEEIGRLEEEIAEAGGQSEETEMQMRAATEEKRKKYSVKQTFHLITTRNLTCQNCGGEQSKQMEDDTELRLVLRTGASNDVQRMVEEAFAKHEIPCDSSCIKTGRKQVKLDRPKLTHLPHSLILHLKRFDTQTKISAPVKFNSFLYVDKIVGVDEDEEGEVEQTGEPCVKQGDRTSAGNATAEVKCQKPPILIEQSIEISPESEDKDDTEVKIVGVTCTPATSSFLPFLPLSDEQRKQLLTLVDENKIDNCLIGVDDKASVFEGSVRADMSDLQRVSTSSDGNCFFNSLSWWLLGEECKQFVNILRSKLGDFIRLQMHRSEWHSKALDLADMLSEIDTSGEWTKTDTIWAAATWLQTPIRIWNVTGPPTWNCYEPLFLVSDAHNEKLEMRPDPKRRGIYMLNSGVHFEPVTGSRSEKLAIERAAFNSFSREATPTPLDSQQLEPEQIQPDAGRTSAFAPAYALTAVICHRGSSTTNGHYTAYIFDKQLGEWLLCDDERQEMVAFSDVRKNAACEAYVMLYEKVESRQAQEALPDTKQEATQPKEDLVSD